MQGFNNILKISLNGFSKILERGGVGYGGRVVERCFSPPHYIYLPRNTCNGIKMFKEISALCYYLAFLFYLAYFYQKITHQITI